MNRDEVELVSVRGHDIVVPALNRNIDCELNIHCGMVLIGLRWEAGAGISNPNLNRFEGWEIGRAFHPKVKGRNLGNVGNWQQQHYIGLGSGRLPGTRRGAIVDFTNSS
jgi:hypothetical protein